MELLSGTHVQTWLDEMKNKKNGKPTDAGTKQRKLSDIRPYWKYLPSHDHVSVDRNPFENRVINNGFTDVEEQHERHFRIGRRLFENLGLIPDALVVRLDSRRVVFRGHR